MKHALVVSFILLFAVPAICQQSLSTSPTVTHFVAPPYPREAKDQRIMGTTKWKLSVAKDGTVDGVTKLLAHPVFEKTVLEAIKQWRFRPSEDGYSFELTISFEFYEEDCEKPLAPETHVIADLPTLVAIRTGMQCVQVHTSSVRTNWD